MTTTRRPEVNAQFLVKARSPERPLAVVVAKSAAEARHRVVTHLRSELGAPGSVRSLQAEIYRSSRLPRHLPVYGDEYFTDPPWNVH